MWQRQQQVGSHMLAGEDVLLFPQALTWTVIKHTVPYNRVHVVMFFSNPSEGLPTWTSNSSVRILIQIFGKYFSVKHL